MSADVFTGPLAIAAGLLVVAGAAKAVRPDTTARALDLVGWGGGPAFVRALAGAEVAVGVWALVAGGAIPAAAVAASYLGFLGFLATAARKGTPLASCGCFGRPDTPPTAAHALVNAGAAGAGIAAAITDAPSLGTVLRDQPWAGVPFAALTGMGVALAVAALTLLPRLKAATR